ncbi:MAG: hypothetical protein IRZ09_01565 [Variibacter sp.]|nr:hypothetical protein [Variibacter sp.]
MQGNDLDRARGAPERPRAEPEIIPPDRARGRPEGDGLFVFVEDREGVRRIHVARPGPLSFILAFVVAGLALAAILLVAFGVVVVLVPVIALAAAALLGYAYLRGTWRRLRGPS